MDRTLGHRRHDLNAQVRQLICISMMQIGVGSGALHGMALKQLILQISSTLMAWTHLWFVPSRNRGLPANPALPQLAALAGHSSTHMDSKRGQVCFTGQLERLCCLLRRAAEQVLIERLPSQPYHLRLW